MELAKVIAITFLTTCTQATLYAVENFKYDESKSVFRGHEEDLDIFLNADLTQFKSHLDTSDMSTLIYIINSNPPKAD
jgi:hypothetical protein